MGLWYFVWNTIENELKFELLIWLCIVFQAEFELYKKSSTESQGSIPTFKLLSFKLKLEVQ